MLDRDDLRQERDGILINDFIDRARQLRRAYGEWLQQELNYCILQGEILEATMVMGIVKIELQRTARRLKEINLQELPEANNNLNDKCLEISDGGWESSDLLGAYQYLDEGLSRFQSLVREVSQIRNSLDALSQPDSEAKQ